jgi:hypothetical protein
VHVHLYYDNKFDRIKICTKPCCFLVELFKKSDAVVPIFYFAKINAYTKNGLSIRPSVGCSTNSNIPPLLPSSGPIRNYLHNDGRTSLKLVKYGSCWPQHTDWKVEMVSLPTAFSLRMKRAQIVYETSECHDTLKTRKGSSFVLYLPLFPAQWEHDRSPRHAAGLYVEHCSGDVQDGYRFTLGSTQILTPFLRIKQGNQWSKEVCFYRK